MTSYTRPVFFSLNATYIVDVRNLAPPVPYHPCRVYLPTLWLIFMVNVGRYTIHGWYVCKENNNLVCHISFHHQEMSFFKMSICAIGSKLPWRFPIYGRDGHMMVINLVAGVYIPFISIPYWSWDDHPQYKELIDPGTYFRLARNGTWFSQEISLQVDTASQKLSLGCYETRDF